MIRQSGVIPYRLGRDELEVLLITNKSGTRWLVPKGKIEPDMTAHDSAAKEAFEEAGVTGRVEPVPVGSFRYLRCRTRHVVDLYPLVVEATLPDWPEMSVRRRQWLTVRDAIRRVDLHELAACLRRFRREALLVSAAA